MTDIEAANEYFAKNHPTDDNNFQDEKNTEILNNTEILKAFIAGCEYKEKEFSHKKRPTIKYFIVANVKSVTTGRSNYDTSFFLEFEEEPNIKEIKEKLDNYFGTIGYNYIKTITKF